MTAPPTPAGMPNLPFVEKWEFGPSEERMLEYGRACYEAGRAATAPPGYVLVPVAPTEAMLHAYATAWVDFEIKGTTLGQRGAHEYHAMLAAAILALKGKT